VLLVGPARAPRVADRRVIALSDPAVPSSRQPYHALMGARASDAPTLERFLRALVERVTKSSFAGLLKTYRRDGQAVRALGLVVGSVIDPATIGNDHIRAHALEGQLFRTALERAARLARVACATYVERTLYETAATRLRRPAAELKRVVAALGAAVDGPWRVEEKAATVAAWMALRRMH
jgi:hypothetical protein